MRPASPNAQQVRSFQAQQNLQAQKDQEDRIHQTQLADQMAQLQNQQSVPGPESDSAAPMTVAQRKAIYGDSPNAPKKTSNVTQAQAEAKQRQLAREKEHQDALNSDTVAIDFAHPNATGSTTAAAPGQQAANVPCRAGGERNPGERRRAGRSIARRKGRRSYCIATRLSPASVRAPPRTQTRWLAMTSTATKAGFIAVFEGTVFEGVVTNHIDGGLAGPMIVMLTTDYYSHDHQQLLLPQGTRLIGSVSSVGTAQARKLFVTFDRAICPDGFSVPAQQVHRA